MLRGRMLALATIAAFVPTHRAVAPAVGPRVSVLAVFAVPPDQADPSTDQRERLMRHLRWAQRRWAVLLAQRDTFALAEPAPRVVRLARPLASYRTLPESGVPQMLAELLGQLGFDRFTCPYILVIVVMNPADDFPTGGGRTINGGVDTGGGLVALSSFALDRIPFFQSTLQHELGHGFGLPHVDVYGYDMRTNPSLMSYDPAHHTDGFNDTATPGTLIPEDLRALRFNRAVFPALARDSATGPPSSYELRPMVCLGPMDIPGQPPYRIDVTTSSGETYGSRAQSIVGGRLAPSSGPGITFDPNGMWQSDRTSTGWVSVDVTFPIGVTVDRIGVHSQHSGIYHAATGIRVEAAAGGPYRTVVTQDLTLVDEDVRFAPVTARTWRLSFRAGESGSVTIRGIDFFLGPGAVFPRCPPA
jgi:hypothetical protein